MRTSLPFDKIAERYDETRGSVEARRRFAEFFEPWLIPGPVLEIGVGTGLVAGVLRERGYSVYGVDMSLPMLVRARERLDEGLACGDACAMPIADHIISNAVFAASLHAIRNVRGAIAEAARVLRPGGRVVATYGEAIVEPRGGGTDDIMDSLRPLEQLAAFNRPDTKEALDAAAHTVGLATIRHTATERMPRKTSPEWFAQQLENRIFSVLWNVDDDSWSRVVVPVIHQLRALPEPSRPRPRDHSYRIAVYER